MYIVKSDHTKFMTTMYFSGAIHIPFIGNLGVYSNKIKEAKVFTEKYEAEAAAIIMGKGAEVVEKIYK